MSEKKHNVLVVGDEIVGGKGDDPEIGGWPERLAAEMPNTLFTISSRPSETMKGAASRIGEIVIGRRPADGWSAVVVAAGLYSAMYDSNKPPPHIAHFTQYVHDAYVNAQALYTAADMQGTRALITEDFRTERPRIPVLYVGSTSVDEARANVVRQEHLVVRAFSSSLPRATITNKRIRLFNESLRRIITKWEWPGPVQYVPFFGTFMKAQQKRIKWLSESGIHPNQDGHQVIACRIRSILHDTLDLG